MSLKTWEARLDRIPEILSGSTPFPADQLKAAASSFYYKLVAGDKYKPSGKLRGEVILVRAKDNYVQLGDDYGLADVSMHLHWEYIFGYAPAVFTVHTNECVVSGCCRCANRSRLYKR